MNIIIKSTNIGKNRQKIHHYKTDKASCQNEDKFILTEEVFYKLTGIKIDKCRKCENGNLICNI